MNKSHLYSCTSLPRVNNKSSLVTRPSSVNWSDRQSRYSWKQAQATDVKVSRWGFTWQSSADGDDTEEDRGEQRQQQRGPAPAPAPRAGEQQHPWVFSGTLNRRRGRGLLSFPHHFFFFFFFKVFVLWCRRASAQWAHSDKPSTSHRSAVTHTLRTVILTVLKIAELQAGEGRVCVWRAAFRAFSETYR